MANLWDELEAEEAKYGAAQGAAPSTSSGMWGEIDAMEKQYTQRVEPAPEAGGAPAARNIPLDNYMKLLADPARLPELTENAKLHGTTPDDPAFIGRMTLNLGFNDYSTLSRMAATGDESEASVDENGVSKQFGFGGALAWFGHAGGLGRQRTAATTSRIAAGQELEVSTTEYSGLGAQSRPETIRTYKTVDNMTREEQDASVPKDILKFVSQYETPDAPLDAKARAELIKRAATSSAMYREQVKRKASMELKLREELTGGSDGVVNTIGNLAAKGMPTVGYSTTFMVGGALGGTAGMVVLGTLVSGMGKTSEMLQADIDPDTGEVVKKGADYGEARAGGYGAGAFEAASEVLVGKALGALFKGIDKVTGGVVSKALSKVGDKAITQLSKSSLGRGMVGMWKGAARVAGMTAKDNLGVEFLGEEPSQQWVDRVFATRPSDNEVPAYVKKVFNEGTGQIESVPVEPGGADEQNAARLVNLYGERSGYAVEGKRQMLVGEKTKEFFKKFISWDTAQELAEGFALQYALTLGGGAMHAAQTKEGRVFVAEKLMAAGATKADLLRMSDEQQMAAFERYFGSKENQEEFAAAFKDAGEMLTGYAQRIRDAKTWDDMATGIKPNTTLDIGKVFEGPGAAPQMDETAGFEVSQLPDGNFNVRDVDGNLKDRTAPDAKAAQAVMERMSQLKQARNVSMEERAKHAVNIANVYAPGRKVILVQNEKDMRAATEAQYAEEGVKMGQYIPNTPGLSTPGGALVLNLGAAQGFDHLVQTINHETKHSVNTESGLLDALRGKSIEEGADLLQKSGIISDKSAAAKAEFIAKAYEIREEYKKRGVTLKAEEATLDETLAVLAEDDTNPVVRKRFGDALVNLLEAAGAKSTRELSPREQAEDARRKAARIMYSGKAANVEKFGGEDAWKTPEPAFTGDPIAGGTENAGAASEQGATIIPPAAAPTATPRQEPVSEAPPPLPAEPKVFKSEDEAIAYMNEDLSARGAMVEGVDYTIEPEQAPAPTPEAKVETPVPTVKAQPRAKIETGNEERREVIGGREYRLEQTQDGGGRMTVTDDNGKTVHDVKSSSFVAVRAQYEAFVKAVRAEKPPQPAVPTPNAEAKVETPPAASKAKNDGELFPADETPFNLDGGEAEDGERIAAEKKAEAERLAKEKAALDAAPVLPGIDTVPVEVKAEAPAPEVKPLPAEAPKAEETERPTVAVSKAEVRFPKAAEASDYVEIPLGPTGRGERVYLSKAGPRNFRIGSKHDGLILNGMAALMRTKGKPDAVRGVQIIGGGTMPAGSESWGVKDWEAHNIAVVKRFKDGMGEQKKTSPAPETKPADVAPIAPTAEKGQAQESPKVEAPEVKPPAKKEKRIFTSLAEMEAYAEANPDEAAAWQEGDVDIQLPDVEPVAEAAQPEPPVADAEKPAEDGFVPPEREISDNNRSYERKVAKARAAYDAAQAAKEAPSAVPEAIAADLEKDPARADAARAEADANAARSSEERNADREKEEGESPRYRLARDIDMGLVTPDTGNDIRYRLDIGAFAQMTEEERSVTMGLENPVTRASSPNPVMAAMYEKAAKAQAAAFAPAFMGKVRNPTELARAIIAMPEKSAMDAIKVADAIAEALRANPAAQFNVGGDYVSMGPVLREAFWTRWNSPRKSGVKDANGRGQVAYESLSGAEGGTPMKLSIDLAGPTAAAQNAFDDRHPEGIDAYVAEKMGWTSAQLQDGRLDGSQIDALGFAIEKIDGKTGMIIGSQTGAGKGRVMAALMLYHIRQGRVPIFMTAKAKLITDIGEDLKDIGATPEEVKALIFNDYKPPSQPEMSEMGLELGEIDEGDLEDNREDAAAVIESWINGFGDTREAVMRTAKRTGVWPGSASVGILTYSQLMQGNESTQRKIALIEGLLRSGKGALILDEAHIAAGEDSNTGAVLRNMTDISKPGVVFSSATFAKRGENMALYKRAGYSQFFQNDKEMADALAKGGVPFQQYLAARLTEGGFYTRTELDYEHIQFNATSTIDTLDTPEARTKLSKREASIADNFNDIIRRVIAFSGDVDDANRGRPKGRPPAIMQGKNFASSLHNVASFIYTALKADTVAQAVVKALQAGKAPVITLYNTNQALLEHIGKGEQADVGRYLARLVDRSMSVLMDDNETYASIRTDAGYNRLMDLVGPKQAPGLRARADMLFTASENAGRYLRSENIPASPIDRIREIVTAAGFEFGEVTGRGLMVEDGIIKTRKRPNADDVVNRFNSAVDTRTGMPRMALLLNSSGAAGLSVHASLKFKNQAPREMFVLQPAWDINEMMQLFGRVNRKNQKSRPVYHLIFTTAAGEQRNAAILMQKLRSLSANTSGTSKAGYGESADDSLDFMNEFGDRALAQLRAAGDRNIARIDAVRGTNAKGIRPFSMALSFMPVEIQGAVIEQLQNAVADMQEHARTNGLHDLEAANLGYVGLSGAEMLMNREMRAYVTNVVGTSKILTAGEARAQAETWKEANPDVAEQADEASATAIAETNNDHLKDVYAKTAAAVRNAVASVGRVYNSGDNSSSFIPMAVLLAKGRTGRTFTDWRVRVSHNDIRGVTSVPLSIFDGIRSRAWSSRNGELEYNTNLTRKEERTVVAGDVAQALIGNIVASGGSGAGQIVRATPYDGNFASFVLLMPRNTSIATAKRIASSRLVPVTNIQDMGYDPNHAPVEIDAGRIYLTLKHNHLGDLRGAVFAFKTALPRAARTRDIGVPQLTAAAGFNAGDEYDLTGRAPGKDGFIQSDVVSVERANKALAGLRALSEDLTPMRVVSDASQVGGMAAAAAVPTRHRLPVGDDARAAFDASIKDKGYFEAGNALVTPPEDPRYRLAFHGSPHLFDRFRLDRVGTGEGAQAYGWGLYFAENRSVAESYTKGRRFEVDGKPVAPKSFAQLMSSGSTPEDYAVAAVMSATGDPIKALDDRDWYPSAEKSEAAKKIIAGNRVRETEPALYEVDLAVEDDELLDWDKPLSEQSKKVKAALVAIDTNLFSPDAEMYTGHSGDTIYNQIRRTLDGDMKAASAMLHSHDIKGIKFLDQMSRGAGKGTRNFVIFNEADIKITKRQDVPAKGYDAEGRALFDPANNDIRYRLPLGGRVQVGEVKTKSQLEDEAQPPFRILPWLRGATKIKIPRNIQPGTGDYDWFTENGGWKGFQRDEINAFFRMDPTGNIDKLLEDFGLEDQMTQEEFVNLFLSELLRSRQLYTNAEDMRGRRSEALRVAAGEFPGRGREVLGDVMGKAIEIAASQLEGEYKNDFDRVLTEEGTEAGRDFILKNHYERVDGAMREIFDLEKRETPPEGGDQGTLAREEMNLEGDLVQTFSVRKARLQQLADEYGVGELAGAPKMTDEAAAARVRADRGVIGDDDMMLVAKDLVQNRRGTALTKLETALMLWYQTQLDAKLRGLDTYATKVFDEHKYALLEAVDLEREGVMQDVHEYLGAMRNYGSLAGQALQALKMRADHGFNLVKIYAQAVEDNGGKSLSPEQYDALKKRVARLEKAWNDYTDAASLPSDAAELEARVTELEAKLAEALKIDADLAEQARSLSERRDALEAELAKSVQSSSELAERKALLDGEIVALENEIAQRTALGAEVKVLEERLSQLQEKMNQLDAELAGLDDGTRERLEAQIAEMEREQGKRQVEVDAAKEALAKARERLRRVQELVKKLGAQAKSKMERRRIVLDNAANLYGKFKEEVERAQVEQQKARWRGARLRKKPLIALSTTLDFVRAMQTMGDESVAGRQLAKLGLAHPILWKREFARSQALVFSKAGAKDENGRLLTWRERSDRALYEADQVLREHELYKVARRAGLNWIDVTADPTSMDERHRPIPAMMRATGWRPIAGVAAVLDVSNNHYAGMSNALRFSVFCELYGMMQRKNGGVAPSDQDAQNIAAIVDIFGSRGDMSSAQAANLAKWTNALLYSPRLAVSNIQFVTRMARVAYNANGQYSRQAQLMIGREYVRLAASYGFLALVSTVLSKLLSDDPNEQRFRFNPGHPAFLQTMWRNLRFDYTGGFAMWLRSGMQITGLVDRVSTETGLVTDKRFGWDGGALLRFVRSKLGPWAGLVYDAFAGKTYDGRAAGPRARENMPGYEWRYLNILQSLSPVPLSAQSLKDMIVGDEDQGIDPMRNPFVMAVGFWMEMIGTRARSLPVVPKLADEVAAGRPARAEKLQKLERQLDALDRDAKLAPGIKALRIRNLQRDINKMRGK